MAFFLSRDVNGHLVGVNRNFGRSRNEISVSQYLGKTYVHISDIRKCFVSGQFVHGNRKSVSLRYEDAMELKDLLDQLPAYKEEMISTPSEQTLRGVKRKPSSSSATDEPQQKKRKISFTPENMRVKLLHKNGVWERIMTPNDQENIQLTNSYKVEPISPAKRSVNPNNNIAIPLSAIQNQVENGELTTHQQAPQEQAAQQPLHLGEFYNIDFDDMMNADCFNNIC